MIASQSLPFPNFSEDYRKQVKDTIKYPPEGSPDMDKKSETESPSTPYSYRYIAISLLMKGSLLCCIFIALMGLSTPVTAQNTEDNDPRDVEIGAGGNIRLEKPYRTELEEAFKWHAHLLWESRYVTEGRDNLSGKGIFSASTEFNYKDINIVPWIADAINADYSEFNLNIVYATQLLDNLEFFVGYNYIRARESGSRSHDNEINFDLAYFYEKQFQIVTNVYYSFDAEGAFAEVAIKKGYRIDNAISINLRAALGFNSGYVVDGHNGINHGQLLASVSYQAIDKMEVYAYASYSLAINRDSNRYTGDELLGDFFWGGVGLSYRF